ncbi:uncharacterized protein LOC143282016 [Babylonia areolata]|uniref:uncharacterized protein LOC143282016 n=1 Tax=Babylonia areolata TaxID=304850 RepID=UPI003FD1773E
MATAYSSALSGPHRQKSRNDLDPLLKNDQEDLLNEPYAVAVLGVTEYTRQDVLQAIKTLQGRRVTLTAVTLMEELAKSDSNTTATQECPPSRERSLKRQANDRYGSDGDSEEESPEQVTAPSPPVVRKGGLDEDGAAPAKVFLASKGVVDRQQSTPSPAKKTNLGKPGHGQEPENLLLGRKLHALREENRRLKARQLCRKCQTRSVSITFLPCGHFAFCYDCGQGYHACPLCRKTILADVRTFLA